MEKVTKEWIVSYIEESMKNSQKNERAWERELEKNKTGEKSATSMKQDLAIIGKINREYGIQSALLNLKFCLIDMI